MGLITRKAIYVEYPQAVPLKYAINPEKCLKLTKDKCGNCEEVCPAKAIDYKQKEERITLNAGAVIFSPGFKPYDPKIFDNYQYSHLPNVVTSMEFERILSASGPSQGHIMTLPKVPAHPTTKKDKLLAERKKDPKKIAWFQCVGSRDMNKCDNKYCSSVCCMYAIKEAVIAKEHAGDELDCAIFYMDMRTHGKEFERYYNRAKDAGVRFVRTKVHTINPLHDSDDLSLRYVSDTGEIVEEIFDMVVLSVGLQISPETIELAQKLGIELTSGNFAQTSSFSPVETSRKGIFVSGAFQGPKDIPQAVVDSSAAAAGAGSLLSSVRDTMTKKAESTPETNIVGERPRIGVFVCRCGTNIAGVVDVPSVRDYASTLPFVEYYTDNLYSCAQDSQDTIAKLIKGHNLNRIVVAACTPKTHEPLFQETLMKAGLNKYLFEMTNIRNQDSWVHKNNPELATKKAKDLVRMAVSKVALMEPLKEVELKVNQAAMVIGAGLAGLTAAKNLADQGYEVHVIEKDSKIGGQANNLYHTYKGENIQKQLLDIKSDIANNSKIHLHLNTSVEDVQGFVGNFKSKLSCNGEVSEIEHGVAVIATGGAGLKPSEYCYGQDDRIIASLDLDKMLMANDQNLKTMKAAVFIQCVGSRDSERPYCSRVCCTHSIDNAIELKKINPEMDVYVIYRDIRAYGEREYNYQRAREAGVIFIRYSLDNKPKVELKDGKVLVTVIDHVLQMPLEIDADILTLASAIVPNRDEKIANFFKVPLNEDGFFVERHAKLGPSEFATDGVFLCGLAHYPKPIDESIAHGMAASSRAVTLLARETVKTSGNVAMANPNKCSSCGVCVSVCPYSAPSFVKEGRFAGKAEINPVLCKGCGLCVASCRSGALHLKGFDTNQIFAQITALVDAA